MIVALLRLLYDKIILREDLCAIRTVLSAIDILELDDGAFVPVIIRKVLFEMTLCIGIERVFSVLLIIPRTRPLSNFATGTVFTLSTKPILRRTAPRQ